MTVALVQEFKPRQIILFGSHARGDARPDSDLDFLLAGCLTPNLVNK
jgi:predicted nucleotidyltransferase